MSGSYPNTLAAGITTEGSFVPFELFAGETDIITDETVVGATALEQFRVVAMDANGKLVPWDPAGADTVTKAIGVMAQAAAANAASAPFYTAASFNSDALVWPAAVTTLAARKAAFAGTPIQVKQPQGSATSTMPAI